MEQTISKPFKKASKVRKLTDNQKVEIVIQKETRPTATSTNYNIAAQFDVSTDLVNRINYEALTPEQKHLYELKRSELKYHAFELTSNAIKKANQLVNQATATRDLSGIVAAMGKANEIYRLETNQPTTITQQNIEPTAQALLNAINQYRDFCQQNNLAFPTNEQLIERINQVASERNIDAKLLQERVLGSQ